MKIVLATGGFDPLHSGHIAYLKAAKNLGDHLIVGINSDEWLERKKGRAFMPWNERLCVVNNLAMVNEVYTFDDEDGSARAFIRQVRAHYPEAELIFVNGGDRTASNIPEMDVVDCNLKFVFAVGGEDKRNSSSWILQEWRAPKIDRPWGYYRVIHEPNSRVKVKELTVNPGCSLSMQKHKYRSEHWFVAEGVAGVLSIDMASTDVVDLGQFVQHQALHISENQWHQLINMSKTDPLRVIEIQYGDRCEEEDIERR